MNNPEISLSFRNIATAQCTATTLAAALWIAGSFIGGFGGKFAAIGAAESLLLLIVSLIILVLFSPNKKRPIASLASLWSATSFIRFLAALVASTLLYYAAQFELRSLLFSFLLTSIFLLIAETRTISSMLTKCSSQTL